MEVVLRTVGRRGTAGSGQARAAASQLWVGDGAGLPSMRD